MLTKLASLAMVCAASLASASPAMDATRQDAQRIWYHDAELRIAEQDLDTARVGVALTRSHWDEAVARGDAPEAGTWAIRHFKAMQAAKEAYGRVLLHRAEHEIARRDFMRDANRVRREARASTRTRA